MFVYNSAIYIWGDFQNRLLLYISWSHPEKDILFFNYICKTTNFQIWIVVLFAYYELIILYVLNQKICFYLGLHLNHNKLFHPHLMFSFRKLSNIKSLSPQFCLGRKSAWSRFKAENNFFSVFLYKQKLNTNEISIFRFCISLSLSRFYSPFISFDLFLYIFPLSLTLFIIFLYLFFLFHNYIFSVILFFIFINHFSLSFFFFMFSI